MSIVKLSIVTAGAVLVAFGTVNKAEAITFSENFNAAAPGLGINDAATFNANTDPNIDVIGEGSTFNPFPSNGRYIDLDGTPSGTAPLGATDSIFSSDNPFSLISGENLILSFDLAGNPGNGGSSNSVVVSLGTVFSETIEINNNAAFQTFSTNVVGDGSNSILSFASNSGNDGSGLYLDNVSLNTAAAVPFELSPALGSLVLAAWGVGIGLQRQMKRKPNFVK